MGWSAASPALAARGGSEVALLLCPGSGAALEAREASGPSAD